MDVEVIDPVPLFRLGLIRALELDAWVSQAPSAREPGPRTVVFLTLSDDRSWSQLADVRNRDHTAVVAVLQPFSLSSATRALRDGAVHVIAHVAEPDAFQRTWAEVIEGTISVPVEIMRAAMAQGRPAEAGRHLDDDEITWLRSLSRGSTVASVAEGAGMSERALYRRLKQLYRRLGVTNRTSALMLGRDEGWL